MFHPGFTPALLTAAKLPVYSEGEVELKSERGVSILQGPAHSQTANKEMAVLLTSSVVIITNYRIALIPDDCTKTAVSCELSVIKSCEDCSSFFRPSTRCHVKFNEEKYSDLFFKFSEGGKAEFIDILLKSISKKSWLTKPRATSSNTPEEVVIRTQNAGVGGILRRQEKEMKQADQLTKESLSDLSALMQRGKDVVAMVQRFAAYANDSEEQEVKEDDSQEMESIMQSIGIISPVTRFSAGRLYHEQLARQIGDVLVGNNRLSSLGGMVSLTDLYCLYNKARGSELVSPDDLVSACQLLEPLKIGLCLRTFRSSGVMVVEIAGFDDRTLIKKLVDIVAVAYREKGADRNYGGVLPSKVASSLKLSLTITTEMLDRAEHKGFVCRDESISGLLYFPNLFPSFVI